MLALLTTLSLASAGQFNVSPTRVTLSADQQSELLTLRNTGEGEVRFQVSAFAWTQSGEEAVVLDPTEDIVVYPSLLTLAPGESRRLRVGPTVPFADSELSYRIFVEELPPLEPDALGAGIHVLTRAGIPIFLAPHDPRPRGEIVDAEVTDDALRFQIHNTGNAYFMVQETSVTGRGGGQVRFSESIRGWYVLAGHARVEQIAIPADVCRSLETIEIASATSEGALREVVEVDPEMCEG